jgi:methanethiol S-methyltransferase
MTLGLLTAFWVTSRMTVRHLVFALLGTVYIAVGVHYEERDLHRDLGPAYDEYAGRVPRFAPAARPARPRTRLPS